MTIKLLLLKSGEDIISDIKEMVIGEDEERRVIGYFLNKPCVVKMRDPNLLTEEISEEQKKGSYQVSLYPWMPLSKDTVIPIATDWVVTMVEPIAKLSEMYVEDILSRGTENNQSNSTDEQSDSNQSD
jgi:hypothetical protein